MNQYNTNLFNELMTLVEGNEAFFFNDWELGIHGKRTGSWNGEKKVQVCGSCHNAHSPHFKQIKPMPAPKKPGRIK